jgi:hypothetical protein
LRGEVQLNGVHYKLKGLPTQTLANQMASKIGQGESEYGDLTDWSAWIQQDWTAGVGKIKPHLNEGFLYGELESRVPGQLILPQTQDAYMMVMYDVSSAFKAWSLPMSWLGTTLTRTTYALANNNYLAWQVNSNNGAGAQTIDLFTVAVFGECDDATVLRADVYSNTGDNPNATLANGSLTVTNDIPGPKWHFISVTATGLSDATNYFIVLRPTTGSITLHGVSNLTPAMTVRTSTNGTVWSSLTTFQPFMALGAGLISAAAATAACKAVWAITYSTHAQGVAVIGEPNLSSGTAVAIYTRDDDSPHLTYRNDYGTLPPTSAAVYNDLIYVARGSTGNIVSFALNLTGSGTLGSVAADLLLSAGGYLWRALGNDLYYTADVSTWTTVGAVCSGPYTIRSMAMMGGDLYLACDDGLYQNAPGDFVRGILPWSPHSDNGKSMVNFEGALYVTVNGRVLRFTQDGSAQDVWVRRDADLPASRLGTVIRLATTDSALVALVNGSTGQDSVWAFQDNSWHHIATMPSLSASVLYYDRVLEKLWVGGSSGPLWGIRFSSSARNPYNDASTTYMPAGWMEWDWFDSTVLEKYKDYDAVTIIGENFSSGVNARIYWKDDGSTGWELLGTIDENNEQIRWTYPYTTRPDTRRFKLGMLLQTNDADETPRVQAIRVKYHLMIDDWWRWSLQVDVSGTAEAYQMSTDGTRNTLTSAQIKSNLEALAADRHIPFLYVDVDGTSYEVKIKDANFSYTSQQYIEATSTGRWEGVFNLVVEQITDSPYVA